MKFLWVSIISLVLSVPLFGCEAREGIQFDSNMFQVKVDKNYAIEVAVLNPSGRFVYLRQADLVCIGTNYSDGVLTVSLDESLGVEWRDGLPRLVDAFDIAGEYEMYISDNLETEFENSYSKTFHVNYVPNEEKQRSNSSTCTLNGKTL